VEDYFKRFLKTFLFQQMTKVITARNSEWPPPPFRVSFGVKVRLIELGFRLRVKVGTWD